MYETSSSAGDNPGHAVETSPGNDPEAPPQDGSASDREAGCAVSIELDTPDTDPPLTGWLDVQLKRVSRWAGVVGGRLSLAVVDDERMALLHEQYRGVAGTTDVLTFDLRDSPGQPDQAVDGDIVICLDVARRQARARGHDTRLEVLLYAVHGLMHLLGEDDRDPAGARKMHRREDELLTRAGLGPVFGRG